MKDIYSRTDPRILGRRLQAARKEADKTQDEAAAKIGLTRQTFGNIEKGERLPKSDELLALAQLYGCTLHDLLRPNEPTEPLEVQFRKSARTDAALERELAGIIKDVGRRMADLRELESLLGVSMPPIQAPMYQLLLGASPTRLGEDIASAERNRLGMGDAPIKNLMEVLEEEEEALSIFQLRLPSSVGGFFGFDPDLGPCIVLNLHHPAERRIWTLIHEYFHFLSKRHVGEIQVTYTYSHIPEAERAANAFAKAFLMPTTSVSRRFHRIKQAEGKFQPVHISRLAHIFCVSFEAMARRLEELRLILPGTFEDLRDRGYKHGEALEHLHLEPLQMTARAVPSRLEYYVGMARERHLITEDQAMDYTGMRRMDLRQRLQVLRMQTIVSDSGAVATVEIPFTDDKEA